MLHHGIIKDLIAETGQMSPAKAKLLGGMNSNPLQSSYVPYQVLDEYFSTARAVSTDATSRLSSNLLVEEFIVPFGVEQKRRAKYTLEGYSIFGGMASLITNGHEKNEELER